MGICYCHTLYFCLMHKGPSCILITMIERFQQCITYAFSVLCVSSFLAWKEKANSLSLYSLLNYYCYIFQQFCLSFEMVPIALKCSKQFWCLLKHKKQFGLLLIWELFDVNKVIRVLFMLSDISYSYSIYTLLKLILKQ